MNVDPWKALALIPALVGVLPGVHEAQCQEVWNLVATSGPPAAEQAAMAFDEARGVTVLCVLGETWTWNGFAWSLASTSGPARRYGATLTYDPLRARTVLFGGQWSATDFGDTWEWDGTSWSLMSVTGPAPRVAHAAGFNLATSTTMIFGGTSVNTDDFGDTWDWNGSVWSLRSASSAIGPRSESALARYDVPGSMVLLGGQDYQQARSFGDTWGITSGSWNLLDTCAISSRIQHVMVYDSVRARAVLFGGRSRERAMGDTWEFDGSWSLVATSGPSPRSLAAMAYDNLRQRVVLFGGATDSGPNGDTWEFSPVGTPTPPTAVQALEIRKGIAQVAWMPDLLSTSSTAIEREEWDETSWVGAITAGIMAPGQVRWLDLPGPGVFRYRLRSVSCAGTSSWTGNVSVLPAPPGAPTIDRSIRRSAVLTWVDRSDFESSFELQRERGQSIGGGPWTNTTLVAELARDIVTYTDRPGVGTWRYRLRAKSPVGASEWTPWTIVVVR